MRKRRQPRRLLRWTGRWRALPELVIVGTQRGGTTSLFRYLVEHPQVVGSRWKEVHFFDNEDNYARGLSWYRSHFKTRRELERRERADGLRRVVLEATPAYMYAESAPARMARDLPDARLVALLRNPIDRALSAHKNILRKGLTELSFEEAVERELAWLESGSRPDADEPRPLLRRGLYAEQLERIFEHFPRERVLALSSEEMFAAPGEACRAVFDFAGLSAHALEHGEVANRSKDRDPVPPAMRAKLAAFFRPHNARLRELLGRDYGWDG